jgi:hypothetical protein
LITSSIFTDIEVCMNLWLKQRSFDGPKVADAWSNLNSGTGGAWPTCRRRVINSPPRRTTTLLLDHAQQGTAETIATPGLVNHFENVSVAQFTGYKPGIE